MHSLYTLLSILAFYQYFNWTDRTIFTDGFVDTMFNIDNDGVKSIKNLTIENVKNVLKEQAIEFKKSKMCSL